MRKAFAGILLLFAIGILLLYACKSGKSRPTEITPEITDTIAMITAPAPTNERFDSLALDSFLRSHPNFNRLKSAFNDFYRQRDYQYVWYHSKGLNEAAFGLTANLTGFENDGVEIPYKKLLDSLMMPPDAKDPKLVDSPHVQTELLLTGMYFLYAERVLKGVDESVSKKLGWMIPRKQVSMTALLDSFLTAKDFDSFEKNALNKQYFHLRDELKKYKQFQAGGPDINIPSLSGSNTRVKPGVNAASVILMRKRMMQLGYSLAQTDTTLYTADMIASVNKAKRVYGLKEDSIIDNSLIAALNVPAAERVKQLLVNMERFRWVPAQMGSDELIVVNIPEFKLHYYVKGVPEWICNVVVGTPVHETVIFSGVMDYVVFSPYWYVPQSIINNEIGLSRAKSASYLRRKNMEWSGGSLREKPGPNNSLGLVKFIFPNSNSIYLHDTPSKSLFDKDTRAFSHGCIRVQKPYDLAKKVLAYDSSWTDKRIKDAMNAGKEQKVVLERKIPVYIGYFTAFADEAGLVHFRKDVYNRDKQLMETLAGK
jgi:murein L,D-transpeptidase YcbB/YkuD